MTKQARVALIKAADTIEALIAANSLLQKELDQFKKEARARKLFTQLRERGYFGDDVDPESTIRELAQSEKLSSYEEILPELSPQTPPWKVSGSSSTAATSPVAQFNSWVMTGRKAVG